jgi:hypothetical protein
VFISLVILVTVHHKSTATSFIINAALSREGEREEMYRKTFGNQSIIVILQLDTFIIARLVFIGGHGFGQTVQLGSC